MSDDDLCPLTPAKIAEQAVAQARSNTTYLMQLRGKSAADVVRGLLSVSGMHDFMVRSADPQIGTLARVAAGLGVPSYVLLLPPEKRDALLEFLDILDSAKPEEIRGVARMTRSFLAGLRDDAPAPPDGKSDRA